MYVDSESGTRVHPKNRVSASMEVESVPLNLGKCKNFRNTSKLMVSEERRQRDLQAKKRYNCYKTNIVIVLKEICISSGNVT